MVAKSMKETEALGAKNWELMNQFRDFLSSLGSCAHPTHEHGDGLASIHWMSSGLVVAKATSIQWGHHCARIAWTAAFKVVKAIVPLPSWQIKEATRGIKATCGEHFSAFKQLTIFRLHEPSRLHAPTQTDTSVENFGGLRDWGLPVQRLSRWLVKT